MARTTVAQRRFYNSVAACVVSFVAGVALTLYVDGTLLSLANMILTHWTTILWTTVVAALSYWLVSAIIRAFLVTLAQYLDTVDNPNIKWKL